MSEPPWLHLHLPDTGGSTTTRPSRQTIVKLEVLQRRSKSSSSKQLLQHDERGVSKSAIFLGQQHQVHSSSGEDLGYFQRPKAQAGNGSGFHTSGGPCADIWRHNDGSPQPTPTLPSNCQLRLLPATLSPAEALQKGWLQEAVALQKKERAQEAADFLPYRHAVNPKARMNTFKRRPHFEQPSTMVRGLKEKGRVEQKVNADNVLRRSLLETPPPPPPLLIPGEKKAPLCQPHRRRVNTSKRMAQVDAWLLRQPRPTDPNVITSNLQQMAVDRTRRRHGSSSSSSRILKGSTTKMTPTTGTRVTTTPSSGGDLLLAEHPTVHRSRTQNTNDYYNNDSDGMRVDSDGRRVDSDGDAATGDDDGYHHEEEEQGQWQYGGGYEEEGDTEEEDADDDSPPPIIAFDEDDYEGVFCSAAAAAAGDVAPTVETCLDVDGGQGDHYYQYSVTGPNRATKTPDTKVSSRAGTTSQGGARPYPNRLSLPTTPGGGIPPLSPIRLGAGGPPSSSFTSTKVLHPPELPEEDSLQEPNNNNQNIVPSLRGVPWLGGSSSGPLRLSSASEIPTSTLPGISRSVVLQRALQTTVTSLLEGTVAAQQRSLEEALPDVEEIRRVRAKHLLPWFDVCGLRPVWFADLLGDHHGLLASMPLVNYPQNSQPQPVKQHHLSITGGNVGEAVDAGRIGVVAVGCTDVSTAYFYHTFEGHLASSDLAATIYDFFLRLSPMKAMNQEAPTATNASSGSLWIPHGRYAWVFTVILSRLYPGLTDSQAKAFLDQLDASLQHTYSQRCVTDLIPRHWGVLDYDSPPPHPGSSSSGGSPTPGTTRGRWCTYAHFALVLALVLEPWCLSDETSAFPQSLPSLSTAALRSKTSTNTTSGGGARGSPVHLLVSVVFPAVLGTGGGGGGISSPSSSSSTLMSCPLPSQHQRRAASTSLVELRKTLSTPQQQQLRPSQSLGKPSPSSSSDFVGKYSKRSTTGRSETTQSRGSGVGLPELFFNRRRPDHRRQPTI